MERARDARRTGEGDGRIAASSGESATGESAADESSTGRVVVVCGLPGVGKTAVSERIADRLDGRLIRTDVVRKELYPEPDYTAAERRSVYQELFARGRETVAAGTAAVLDATFGKRRDRDRAASVAAAADAPLDVVRVECEEHVVRERIAARADDESDADFDVYLHLRDRFDAIERDHERIDNSGDIERTRRQIEALF